MFERLYGVSVYAFYEARLCLVLASFSLVEHYAFVLVVDDLKELVLAKSSNASIYESKGVVDRLHVVVDVIKLLFIGIALYELLELAPEKFAGVFQINLDV